MVLRYLLEADVGFRQVLEIECRRVLLRNRMLGVTNDDQFARSQDALEHVLSGISLWELDPSIKRRAMEAFPTHVKTLDALHLATALSVARAYSDETVAVFSYDAGMNRAAKALGLAAPWYS